MEWKRIFRKEPAVTGAGLLYMREVYGYECSTPSCRQVRWSRPGEDRRPEDQCELCCPKR